MAVPACYVYFDTDLIAEPLIEANWQVRINGWLRTIALAVAETTRVRLETGAPLEFNPGADRVRYFAAPAELRGINGLPVDPFVHPITRTD